MGVTELISPEYEASREFVKRIMVASGQDEAKLVYGRDIESRLTEERQI
jgi:hypothetical protein